MKKFADEYIVQKLISLMESPEFDIYAVMDLFQWYQFKEDILIKCISTRNSLLEPILYYQRVSVYLIEMYKHLFNKMSWVYLSRWQKLSKDFIAENVYNIDIKALLNNHLVSEEIKDYARMFI